jgi:hypothetical protein
MASITMRGIISGTFCSARAQPSRLSVSIETLAVALEIVGDGVCLLACLRGKWARITSACAITAGILSAAK